MKVSKYDDSCLGHGYQLQERDNGSLLSDNWVDEGSPVDGSGSPITLHADMSSDPQGFYRVHVRS